MNSYRIGSRVNVPGHLHLGIVDHQMHVERDVRHALEHLDMCGTDGEIGNEVAIHHVDVYPIGTCLGNHAHVAFEIREIGAQYGRGDLDVREHGCLSLHSCSAFTGRSKSVSIISCGSRPSQST